MASPDGARSRLPPAVAALRQSLTSAIAGAENLDDFLGQLVGTIELLAEAALEPPPALPERAVDPAAAEEAAARVRADTILGPLLFAGVPDDVADAADIELAASYNEAGIEANQTADYAAAARNFEAAHRVRPRVSTALSIANMQLKLDGGAPLAAALYASVAELRSASPGERLMARRKLQECAPRGGVSGTPAPPSSSADATPRTAGTPREAALSHRVTQLEAELVAQAARADAHAAQMAAGHRQREGSLEGMLHEVSAAMRQEVMRAGEMKARYEASRDDARRHAARLAAAAGYEGGGAAAVAAQMERYSDQVCHVAPVPKWCPFAYPVAHVN